MRCNVTLRRPGTRIPILIRRGDKNVEVMVTLGEAPATTPTTPMIAP
jgi:hypothetical protein